MAESTVRSRHRGRWAIVVLVLVMVSVAIPASRGPDIAWSVHPLLTADQISLSNITPWELQLPPPQPAATIELPINILFMGVPSSLIDTSVLSANLLPSYTLTASAPIAASGTVNRYATYVFNYSVATVASSTANAYAGWVQANLRQGTAPYWIQELQPFPANEVGFVNASAALDWLQTNLNAYTGTGYTIVFVDAYHTSPSVSSSLYYFYESDTKDLETGFVHMPTYSQFMTGFGGGTSRLLFVDLSAGPAHASMGGGLAANETNMPPVWTYAQFDSTKFSHDTALYTDYAIMQRFVPSYFAPPELHPSYWVEVTIYNDDPAKSFLPYLDLRTVLNAYAGLEPFSTFGGIVRELPLSSDTQLDSVVTNLIDPITNTLDDSALLDYLKQNLALYVTPHGSDTVIPVILLGLPGRLSFASGALGWATTLQGRAAYILAYANDVVLGLVPWRSTPASDGVTWAANTFTVPAGGSTFFTGGAPNVPNAVLAYASGQSWLNGTFDVGSGRVDFYLFTEYEYANFSTWGGGSPLVAGTGLVGPGWTFSLQVPAPGYYYAVFADSAFTSPAITFSGTLETYDGGGFTATVVHEGGHFLGLAHPHQGIVWPGPLPYANWFFDFTPSPMSYMTVTYRFDQFDKDAVLRGNALLLMSEALTWLGLTQAVMKAAQVRYIPFNVMDAMNESVRDIVLAKLYLEANAYPEAVVAAAAAILPAEDAMSVLLVDLSATPSLRANLTPADGLAANHAIQVAGDLYDILNTTLQIVIDGKAMNLTYGTQGNFTVSVRNIPWGTHSVVIKATDANGTVMTKSFTVTVPIDAWVWAALVAGAAAAVIAAVLLVRRRKRSRATLPPTSDASETGAAPPAFAPAGFEPPPPPPSNLPPPPQD